MAKHKPDFVTTRDIVIPAGTRITSPPVRSSRWGSDFEGIVEIDRDHCAWFSINVAEGIEAGVVEAIDGPA